MKRFRLKSHHITSESSHEISPELGNLQISINQRFIWIDILITAGCACAPKLKQAQNNERFGI
jgi:hypothetical protein